TTPPTSCAPSRPGRDCWWSAPRRPPGGRGSSPTPNSSNSPTATQSPATASTCASCSTASAESGRPARVAPDERDEPVLQVRVLGHRLLLPVVARRADGRGAAAHPGVEGGEEVGVHAAVLAAGAREVPGVHEHVGGEVLVHHLLHRLGARVRVGVGGGGQVA